MPCNGLRAMLRSDPNETSIHISYRWFKYLQPPNSDEQAIVANRNPGMWFALAAVRGCKDMEAFNSYNIYGNQQLAIPISWLPLPSLV